MTADNDLMAAQARTALGLTAAEARAIALYAVAGCAWTWADTGDSEARRRDTELVRRFGRAVIGREDAAA